MPQAALAPGTRQTRRPMREVEPGLYEVTFQAIEAGVWYVFLESADLGLEARKSAGLMLEALTPDPSPAPPTALPGRGAPPPKR